MSNRVIHALVGGSKNYMTGGAHRHSLWCSERTTVAAAHGSTILPGGVGVAVDSRDKHYAVTDDLSKVTCKRCIALGGCGPSWKGAAS